jgi:SAM-dependent methyltransferase
MIDPRMPPRLRPLYNRLRARPFTILDVGCGNHSPTKTKHWFPKCQYFGIDRALYNIDDADLRCVERLFLIDLDSTELDDIPDLFFDAILVSHVIEHLKRGLEVLHTLASKKLKPGGLIYVEFPSIRAMALPTMPGTLNFCDDDTHIRIYDVKDVANVLLEDGLKILRAGRRRCLDRIFGLPMVILYCLVSRIELRGGYFWDLLGFADFVFAEKSVKTGTGGNIGP